MTTVDEAKLLLFDASAICTPSGVEANHLFRLRSGLSRP